MNRFHVGVVLIAGLGFLFTGCGSNTDVGSLQITPASQSIIAGQTAQFTASGTIGHGKHPTTNQDVTTMATWTSSAPSVATINSSGLATAVAAGTATITASMPGIPPATATIAVTGVGGGGSTTPPEPLVSLAVIPNTQTALVINETAAFFAIGTTASGATVDLTNKSATVGNATIQPAVWASTIPSVASINSATGVATALTSGSTTITATAKNPDGTVVTGSGTLTVNISSTPGAGEPLVSIGIVPGAQTLTVAKQNATFIALGTTGSGTTVNLTNQPAIMSSATIKATVWNSSSPGVATIDSATGIATAVSNGVTVITAISSNPDGTVVTGTATLTVNITAGKPEDIVSLAIIPNSQTALAINQTSQFIAIGTAGDGTTKDLTKLSNWTSSNASVAKIFDPTTGLATALSSGSTAITALYTNADGTVVTGTAVFTVTLPGPEPLVSLSIIPSSQTALAINQTNQFIAIGTTGTGATVDLTNQASWSSSNTAIADFGPTPGLATARGSGTTAITAIVKNPDKTVVTGTAAFTVTSNPEPLVSLSIIPVTQTAIAAGQSVQYYAIGTTSSGATVDLTSLPATIGTATINPATWNPTNAAVATVTAPGQFTATGTGTTAITAAAQNPDGTVVIGTAALTVTNPTWVSLSIVPNSQTAQAVGETAQFIAIGTTGDGLSMDLTDFATWQSSDPSVAKFDPANPKGEATALTSGTATISAQYSNNGQTIVQGSATFTVNITASQEPLLSLAIVPSSQSVGSVNETGQFIAIGTFSSPTAQTNPPICTPSTGLTRDCTSSVTWSSSDVKVATINATGLATGLNAGTTAITAMANNPDGTIVTGAASFTEGVNGTGTQYTTLAITLVGANAASGTVTLTSPGNPTFTCSATAMSGCVYTLPLNTNVTLTATPLGSATFSGWSLPCVASGTGPCTTTLGDNQTIAAIFN